MRSRGGSWITRAADAGVLDARVALAEMMVNGRGGRPRPLPRRLVLFEGAARDGHIGAMFAVGALYGGGHEVETNRPMAQQWFRLAAERGHGYAQMMLGRYLARSLAGEQNITEAKVLVRGSQGPRGGRSRWGLGRPSPGASCHQRPLPLLTG